MTALPDIPLPAGIRSRYVDDINGLRMHVLEAGFETKGRPCILLLHGFPELAFSWRKVMPALGSAGYHVIAPDQRGYGRTTGWSAEYDSDLAPFSLFNLVRDALGLVSAFGYRQVDVIGHDFGQPGRGVVRADAARRVSFGGDDECAVRRSAAAAVRHDRHAGKATGRRSRASRARRAAASAQALSMVLCDAPGECRHAPRAAGRA
ncbi:alpha/beta fold hydrolase [Bradyrhizobium sp. LM2.9]